MIDGAEWFAAITFPHIRHEILKIGDAVTLAIALVVQPTALIDAIGGHALTTETTIASIALVYQWITFGRAFDHGVQLGHIALAAIIGLSYAAVGAGAQGPFHGVAKWIIGTRYIHIIHVHQIFELCFFLIGRQDAYVCHAAIKLLLLQVQSNMFPWILHNWHAGTWLLFLLLLLRISASKDLSCSSFPCLLTYVLVGLFQPRLWLCQLPGPTIQSEFLPFTCWCNYKARLHMTAGRCRQCVSSYVRENWIHKFGTSHGQQLESISLRRWHFEYETWICIQHAGSIHFRYYVIQ